MVIGVSTGGVQALKKLLGPLPADFPLPILVVQHIGPDAGSGLARLLDEYCLLRVKEADEQDAILPGTVYLAPPNYHLLVERDGCLSLSADPHVSFARPSVDVLFESAAEVFGPQLIGIVLTGANHDGARGLARIKSRGGLCIVQSPDSAQSPAMPLAALEATLRLYRDPDRLAQRLPTLRLLTRPQAVIAAAGERLLPAVQAAVGAFATVTVEPCASQIGSGALPVDLLPSWALVLRPPSPTRSEGRWLERMAGDWRDRPVPVIGRVADGALWLDLRCLEDEAAFLAQLP